MNGRARLLRTAYPTVCLLFLAIAMAPLWLVEHPPLNDWFNLLARLQLLSQPDHPALDSHFRVEWRFLPALGLELVALPLAALVSPGVAMKLTICLAFAALIAGTMLLHYGLYRGITPVSALACLLLWNEAAHVGLVGYLVGIALALFVLAAWLLLAARPALRLALCTALAVLVLLAHLYAFAFLGLTLGTIEAVALLRAPAGERRVLQRAGSLAVLFGVPALCLLLLGPPFDAYRSPETTGPAAGMVVELVEQARLYFHRKGVYLWYLIGGDIVNDRPMELWARVAAAVLIVLVPLTVLAAWRRPHWGALAALAAAIAVYLLLPPRIAGSYLADWRLLIATAFLAVAALPPAPAREFYRVAEVAVVVVVAALLAWRAIDLTRTWRGAQHHIADFDKVTASLPTGAKLYVYVMQVPWVGPQFRRDTRFLTHIASRAVAQRAALVPTQFATPAAQSLRFRPEVDFVRLPWEDKVADAITVHWEDVMGFFDHVLVVKLSDLPAPPDVGLPDAGLTTVAEAGVFRLYEVRGRDG